MPEAVVGKSPIPHKGILTFNLVTDPVAVVLSSFSLVSFTESVAVCLYTMTQWTASCCGANIIYSNCMLDKVHIVGVLHLSVMYIISIYLNTYSMLSCI